MGLTRSSSGLLVFDAFGSDTTGDYAVLSGVTQTISGGYYSLDTVDGMAVHTDSSGALCVTAKTWRGNGGGSGSAAMLTPNVEFSSTNDYDCYNAHHSTATTSYRLQERNNGGFSTLASSAATVQNAWMYSRVYRNGNDVYGRYGTSDLSVSVNATDTTYTGTLYGGYQQGRTASVDACYADWLDIRTAHTITCTGMTTGHYLRVSDGTTAAEAQESSGTATVDAGAVLFPLASVQIRTAAAGGGDLIAELDTGDYADMGGGDAFAYSGASAAWLPFMKHNVIGLGGLHG